MSKQGRNVGCRPKSRPKQVKKEESTEISHQFSTPLPNTQPPQLTANSDLSSIGLSTLSLSTASSEDFSAAGVGNPLAANKGNPAKDHDTIMNAYSRYLQAVMLKIQTKKALERLRSEAVVAITLLANETYQLKEKYMRYKKALDKVKGLKLLGEQVDEQHEILNTLCSSLSTLDGYSALSKCVDDCSHKLPVKDIVTDKKEIESLVETLKTNNKIVKELATKVSISEVHEEAKLLTDIKNLLEETMKTVSTCDKSLESLTSISIQTTSMQIENIQESSPDQFNAAV